MLKRISIYLKEMYPVASRIVVAAIMFFEIYFIDLMNNNIHNFSISYQEIIAIYTIFSFLLILRIADDFKDYELDCRLFSHRPLPSGRVTKRDLIWLLAFVVISSAILNLLFMNNRFWFCFLYIYGTLMSFWFFQKDKIQPSLPLALITHNPVMLILNMYTISFVSFKYNIPLLSWPNLLLLFTMYFPSLIWELTRKIRPPKEETEYVTYSKLFGYKKMVHIIQLLISIDIITNILLLMNLNIWGCVLLTINVIWILISLQRYCNNPYRFNILKVVNIYTFFTEAIMLLIVFISVLRGQNVFN